MTDVLMLELAKIRAELFGMRVLLTNCLMRAAESTEKPIDYLTQVEREALQAIANTKQGELHDNLFVAYQDAAKNIIVKTIELARVPLEPKPSKGQIQ